MAKVHDYGYEVDYVLYAKGAPEMVMRRCSYTNIEGDEKALNPEFLAEFQVLDAC